MAYTIVMSSSNLYSGSRTQTAGTIGRTVTIASISRSASVSAIIRGVTAIEPRRWIGDPVVFASNNWEDITNNWEDITTNWENLG